MSTSQRLPDGSRLDDWISQAEAARLRKTSRQAISKLVRLGRLRTLAIAGKQLVSRSEVMAFEARPAGRPVKKSA